MNKKELFIISWHSIICEITNSSTELFVLDTDKAIELVRDIVKEKEKEFPPEYGHYLSVDYSDDWDIQNAFGYFEEEEVVAYLKAKGYTVEPPKDPKKTKYLKIYAERGGLNWKLKNFIEETFNVIHYTTEA